MLKFRIEKEKRNSGSRLLFDTLDLEGTLSRGPPGFSLSNMLAPLLTALIQRQIYVLLLHF